MRRNAANPHSDPNSSHRLVRQCVCACGWMCAHVMVSMWVAGWMDDLRESVRKFPERIGVRISLPFPHLAAESTQSLWLESIKRGQPLCEFRINPYLSSPLLLTHFLSLSLFFQAVVWWGQKFLFLLSFQETFTSIQLFVQSQRKNTLCTCLTFWSHNTLFPKAGSSKPPESSSINSGRFLSGLPLNPSAPTVTKSDSKVSAKLLERKKKKWQNYREEEEELTEWERQRDRNRVCLRVCRRCQPKPRTCSAQGLFQFVSAFNSPISNFVIDVSRALRRHLLNDVDRVAVIAADLLVVRAEDAVSSPERDDDITGLWAVIVPAASTPLGRGQGA